MKFIKFLKIRENSKKIIAFITSIPIALSFAASASASNSPVIAPYGISEEAEFDEYIPTDSVSLESLPSKSSVLMEQSTGKILFERNPHEKMAPASIAKIMTMLLIVEAIESNKISKDDMVTVSEHANSMGGSQIWLKIGEQMSVHDLLKAIAVASANDASVAMAEYIEGTEEAFVNKMNEKAKSLGMNNTSFKNASGLDAEGQYTTAYDIALMSGELISHELIKEYSSIWMDSLRNGETSLVNTNKLVRFYQGCTGLKTGTTDDAGCCLSVTASRNEMSLIAVTMGSQTNNERFDSGRTLLDYGFSNFEVYNHEIDANMLKPLKVIHGVKDYVEISAENLKPVVIPKGRSADIQVSYSISEDAKAPVEEGQTLGTIKIELEGTVLEEIPVKSKSEVKKMTFGSAFMKLLKALISFS